MTSDFSSSSASYSFCRSAHDAFAELAASSSSCSAIRARRSAFSACNTSSRPAGWASACMAGLRPMAAKGLLVIFGQLRPVPCGVRRRRQANRTRSRRHRPGCCRRGQRADCCGPSGAEGWSWSSSLLQGIRLLLSGEGGYGGLPVTTLGWASLRGELVIDATCEANGEKARAFKAIDNAGARRPTRTAVTRPAGLICCRRARRPGFAAPYRPVRR